MLIEEIKHDAVDANSDLGTLLRKCELLAAELGSQPLEDWLIWESNGYPEGAEFPNYRIWTLEIRGDFAGPYRAQIPNYSIPLSYIPANERGYYKNYKCAQSIASIEALIKECENQPSGALRVSTKDLASVLGTKVWQGYSCIEAWAQYPKGELVEVLNAVRNRILDFVLAVSKIHPTVASGGNTEGALESKEVNQVFHTTIYDDSTNIAGSSTEISITMNIIAWDFSSLAGLLRKKGVQEENIDELKQALESDEPPEDPNSFGPKVSEWIVKMSGKAADGSRDIGIGGAGSFLGQVLGKYFGF